MRVRRAVSPRAGTVMQLADRAGTDDGLAIAWRITRCRDADEVCRAAVEVLVDSFTCRAASLWLTAPGDDATHGTYASAGQAQPLHHLQRRDDPDGLLHALLTGDRSHIAGEALPPAVPDHVARPGPADCRLALALPGAAGYLLAAMARPAAELDPAELARLELFAALVGQALARVGPGEPALWRTAADLVADAIVIADDEHRMRYVNDAFTALYGYRLAEVEGQPAAAFFADEPEAERAGLAVREAARERGLGGELQLEVRQRRRDGSRFWVEKTIRPVQVGSGLEPWWVEVIRDTSASRARERALRDSRERYRALFEGSPVAYCLLDAAGLVRQVNGAHARLTGYDQDELAGRHISLLLANDDPGYLEARLSGGLGAHEADHLTKSGEVVPCLVHDTLVVEDGRQMGLLAALVDQRPVRRAEEALRRAERVSTLGELSHGVAHDLSNLLTAILGAAQVAYSRIDDPELLRECLRIIEQGAVDGGGVLRRVLEFGRPRSHRPRQTIADLSEIVRDAVRLTRPHWRDRADSESRPVRLVQQLDPAGPVLGREAELREVMVNLIINSLQAMHEGGSLTVATGMDDDAAWMAVADTGSGMTDEVRRKAFDPFFTTKHEGGHGMGLCVVARVVQWHGGEVQLDTTPGLGTTFTVRLPRSSATQPLDETYDPAAVGPLRVLLVEDDPNVRHTLAAILEELGHEVTVAGDAAQARDRYDPERFDLVITDYHLPDSTGSQLADHIKACRPARPVILATGWGSAVQTEAIDVVVCKPFRADELQAAIAKVRSA